MRLGPLDPEVVVGQTKDPVAGGSLLPLVAEATGHGRAWPQPEREA